MEVPNFEVNEENVDIPVNENILRLKCGHAFHSMCIALALRTNVSSCPLCRTPAENGRIVISVDDEETTFELPSSEEILELELMNMTLRDIRTTDKTVQNVRHELHKEKRKLYKLVEELQSARARRIKEAVNEFRLKHRNEWEKQKRRVQRKLTVLHNCEFEALVQKVGSDRAKDIIDKLEYDANVLLQGCQPNRKAFWTR
jgi:hypothetical protein